MLSFGQAFESEIKLLKYGLLRILCFFFFSHFGIDFSPLSFVDSTSFLVARDLLEAYLYMIPYLCLFCS